MCYSDQNIVTGLLFCALCTNEALISGTIYVINISLMRKFIFYIFRRLPKKGLVAQRVLGYPIIRS